MLIRRAIDTDAAAIRQIHRAAILEICSRDYPAETVAAWACGSSEARFVQRIAEQSFWVAIEQQQIVAFGSVHVQGAKLEALFLAPAAVGRGLAGQLLRHLENIAIDSGIATLHLDSSLSGLAFYRKHGYDVQPGDGSIKLASGMLVDGIPMLKSLKV
jgi:GNAT superfamily N-acetyltransferase